MVRHSAADPSRLERDLDRDSDPESDRALERLRRARSVVVTGHQQPDADVIGSAAMLFAVLRELGKRVELVLPDAAPGHLTELMAPFPFQVAGEVELPEVDLVVLVDGSDPGRMGRLGEDLLGASPRPELLVVDHHLHDGEPAWDYAFRDPRAAATAVMMARIAARLGIRLPVAAAELGLAALVSDTGGFRFESTDPEAFETAAGLVRAGARPNRVFESMRGRNEPERPTHRALLYGAAEYRADGRIALLPVSPELARRTEGTDPARVYETLRGVRGVEAVVSVRARPDGSIKFSLRTRAPIDAARIARSFGGGGHVRAAGATLRDATELDFAAACERVVEAVTTTLDAPVPEATP